MMIYGPLSELLGRRYCRKAGWSAAGLLWGPLSCEVVAGFQSHEATPHHAPQLPVCLGHCEVHTSSPATTVAEPRVGRRPHHCSCLCPPADQHKQTCRSPFGIHHAHPVHTQACLSQLSPLIATPPPPRQERLSLLGPGGNSQGQMGRCPEPHAGRACTDTFSVRAGNHLPEPSWDGSMGLCWEGQHCPNWAPQLQGSEWGAPS